MAATSTRAEGTGGPALQRALGRVFQGHPQSPGGEGGGAVSPRRLGQRLFGTPALLSGGLSMLPTTSRPRQPAHGPLAENAHSPADSGQAANCRLPGRPRVSTSGQVVSEDPCATTLRRAAAPTHLPASSTSSRLTRRLPGTITSPPPPLPLPHGEPLPLGKTAGTVASPVGQGRRLRGPALTCTC